MALPATDNFDRGDGALGANWTGSVGSDLTIVSQAVTASSDVTDCSMYWNADIPDAAQYVQLVLSNADLYAGPTCRGSTTDWVYLESNTGGSNWAVRWYNGGAFTQIGSFYSTAPADGDLAKITADGSTFKGYINGTERISGSNASAPASGRGGIYCYSNVARVDDFEVGNLVTIPDPTVIFWSWW